MKTQMDQKLAAFLGCPTPQAWVTHALQQLDVILVDHAHCEKKAASTALSLMYRYPDKPDLLLQMSRLAREELRHFEQVLKLIKRYGYTYDHLSPPQYAHALHQLARTHEPARLIDVLIIGAFIEARSCERFAVLIPHLEGELADFYQTLLACEARHFEVYLALAHHYAKTAIDDRIAAFRAREAQLILAPDSVLRFHSGIVELAVVTAE